MPADRTQLLEERVDALLDLLERETNLPPEWADTLRATEEIGQGQEISKAHKNGNAPPEGIGK